MSEHDAHYHLILCAEQKILFLIKEGNPIPCMSVPFPPALDDLMRVTVAKVEGRTIDNTHVIRAMDAGVVEAAEEIADLRNKLGIKPE